MQNCKLIIRDEVNIKFEGLPVEVRRKISNALKFELPYARHMPQYKLGRWDGTTTFFGIGGNGYLNHLETILPILDEAGIQIEEVEDLRHPHQFNFQKITSQYWADRGKVWPPGHPIAGQPIILRDYQLDAINGFMEHPQGLQELATGAGKCQPLYSKVLTPNGWTTMGGIKVGDRVLTPTGKSVEVLNVYDPGVKDVYEIEFSDGRTARSCLDHVWRVYNIGWNKSKTGPWRNITTAELIELKSKTKRSIGIQLPTFEHDTNDVELPIDPWLFGFLLGDGSFGNDLGFTTADQELVEKVRSKLHPDYDIKQVSQYDYRIQFKDSDVKNQNHSANIVSKDRDANGRILPGQTSSSHMYVKLLQDFGLANKLSHEKFIPDVFFTGSLNQRLELIRGLADSDGTIDKSSVYFCSTSKRLAEDFQRLIRSVGGIARLSVKTDKTYKYNDEIRKCKDAYYVATKYHTPWDLVSLTRKKDATGYSYQYGPTLKLNVKSIKKVSTEPVRCIYIDDPDHLYITDDYVVTHNTIITATLSALCEPYGRTLVIVPNKGLVVQTEEDYRNVGLDVGVYFGDRKELNKTHTICTWQSLNILDKKGATKDALTLAEFLDGVVCVIVDEAHMAKAEVLKKLLNQNMANTPIRWGLTGTVPKEAINFHTILSSIGPVVNKISAHQLQEKGVLSNCHVNIVQLVDVKAFRTYQEELKYLVSDDERMGYISSMCNGIKEDGNTLILVDRIDAGKYLEATIPGSIFISGEVKLNDRKEHYDEVRTSDTKVIIATYGVAAVGLNIPRIFNLVLLEPGKSFVRVIQSIGRGIRKAEDKDFVQIWDITSTCKYAKRHLTERKKFYKDAHYPFTLEKVNWQQ